MRFRNSGPPSGAIVGGVMVLVGTVLLLDRMHFVALRDYFRYWPALLVAFGLLRIWQGPDNGARVFGGLVTLAGTVMLTNRLGLTDLRVFDLWPVAIIGGGVAMLWNTLDGRRPAPSAEGAAGLGDSWVQFSAIFGGVNVRSTSPAFEGGNLTAIFGGCEVDLTRARIAGESATLTLAAIFGGVSLRIPEDWTIVFEGTPIFGGYDDRSRHPQPVPGVAAKTLYIRGSVAFGGIEVKN